MVIVPILPIVTLATIILERKVAGDSRHGFTNAKMYSLIQGVTGCVDKRVIVDAVYLDFSNVFDMVSHTNLKDRTG